MSLSFKYSRFDGKAVDVSFVHSATPNIQHILEEFEEEFKKANGHIDAFIKDDLGHISLTIECEDSDLKERMYQKLRPHIS